MNIKNITSEPALAYAQLNEDIHHLDIFLINNVVGPELFTLFFTGKNMNSGK